MKQVIIFDKNSENLNAFKKELSEYLSFELTELNQLEKVLSIIPILPDLDLILSNADSLGPEVLHKLELEMTKNSLEIPLIIFGSYKAERKSTFVYPFNADYKVVSEKIKSMFIESELTSNTIKLPKYVAVSFPIIQQYRGVPFPVSFYLRIKQSGGEFQFVKRLSNGNVFTPEEIQNLIKFNLEFLYVHKDEYKLYLEFSNKLINTTNKNSILDTKDIKLQDFTYHISRESLTLVGVNTENIALVEGNIHAMETMISQDNALANYLKKSKENNVGYTYSHSYLLSIVLTKVVSSFDWDSKTIKEKICYAAFFHDIALSEDRLCRVHSEAELKEFKNVENDFSSELKAREKVYTEIECDELNYHAINSSLILDKFPNVPMGVTQVVKEHHGAKNGIGFNDSQSLSLQPLSMIFIVVEDFVVEFLKISTPNTDDIKLILKKLTKKYTKGNYARAVEALQVLVKH